MTRTRQPSSATGWALLALLVATLLGHVCVLPLHAHAATATTHPHEHDSDGPDEAAHIGSCEAVASSPIAQPFGVVTSTAEWAAPPLEAVWVAHDRVAAPPPRSTPLFLLHAALLI